MKNQFAYLFLEICMALTGILFTYDSFDRHKFISRRIVVKMGLLFLLWLCVDLAALWAEIWYFPDGGTLPIRLLGLPIEEYIVFVLHSLGCLALASYFSQRQSQLNKLDKNN